MSSLPTEPPPQRDPLHTQSAAESRPRGSYSLLLLFYLTTLAAILASICRMAFDNSLLTLNSFALGTVIVAVIGSLIGSVIGFLNRRGALGMVLGACVGVGVSPFAAWVALVAPERFASAQAIVFVGCWFVIVIAIAANRHQTTNHLV